MAEGWIDCRGAPRDLGLDQGVLSGAAIRREARHAGRWRRRGENLFAADLTRLTRDLDRHFPHLGERLSGLARGARISRRRLERLLARELGATTSHRAGSGVLVGLGSGPRLARSLDLARDRETPVVLRRSEPDHGHATLSVTLIDMSRSAAAVGTLIIRFGTLWFGVIIGLIAFAILSRRLAAQREGAPQLETPGGPPAGESLRNAPP